MFELMHRVNLMTELGQTYDNLVNPSGSIGLQQFTMKGYETLITYKTGFVGFTLPVQLALHYLGLGTPGNITQSERLCIALGNYLQVQDDFLDVFGDPAVLGKVGTDIQESKCTWLIITALELGDDEQRRELEHSYGVQDVEAENHVKKIFRDLRLDGRYAEYQKDLIAHIEMLVSQIDEREGLRKAIFERVLSKVFKRNKWQV